MLTKLTISNLAHRPVRTLLSILAIAVEVTMIFTLLGVSNGTLHESARRAHGTGADILVRAPGASSALTMSSSPMNDKFVDVLRQEPHITMPTGTMVQPLELFDTITELDLNQFAQMSGGFRFTQGGLPVEDTDMIVDEPYAREKRLHVGSTLNLISQQWRVSGIYEPGKLARICVKLDPNCYDAEVNVMEAAWEFAHSIECNAPREFCWSYWTNIANWDDPPAKFRLEEPFEDGSRITTELPGQTLVSVIRDVRAGHAATIEIDLPNALFCFHWSFDDLAGKRTRISQRLVLSGVDATLFLDQAKVMGDTAPEGLKKLIAAMERAQPIVS